MLSRRDLLRGTAFVLTSRILGRRIAPHPQPPDADAEIRRFMQTYAVPGFSVTFARGPAVLYSGMFGVADRSPRTPVTAQCLFRIASNSKAFTAAAIFTLIEAGRLSLEGRVFAPDGILARYSHLGTPRDWVHAITVHQLLTHTCGGWSNERNDPMFEKNGFDHEQLIAWTLETHPLDHLPGTKYAYSNFGYCLLGRVIEQVSGMPYARYVQQHVMRVAGIHDMRIATHTPAPDEVTYYGQDGGDPYDIPITRMDSHGGWIATSADMTRFLACLFSPTDREGTPAIVTPASLAAMTTGSEANHGYACGLAVNAAGNAWHEGALAGTQSLMVHTHGGLSWSAVMNTERTDPGVTGGDLDRMLWRIARSVPEWNA